MKKCNYIEGINAFTPADLSILAALLLALNVSPALAGDDYQQNALFHPSEQQLTAEAKGKVVIYDGLDNATVDRALNQQYGRMQHMMFVRTQYPAEEEYDESMDDGCDD